jgi:hypothetical protein
MGGTTTGHQAARFSTRLLPSVDAAMSAQGAGSFAGFGDSHGASGSAAEQPQLPIRGAAGDASTHSVFQLRLKEAGVPAEVVTEVAKSLGAADPTTVDMDDFGFIELSELRALLLTAEVGRNKLSPWCAGRL